MCGVAYTCAINCKLFPFPHSFSKNDHIWPKPFCPLPPLSPGRTRINTIAHTTPVFVVVYCFDPRPAALLPCPNATIAPLLFSTCPHEKLTFFQIPPPPSPYHHIQIDLSHAVDVYHDWIDACEAVNASAKAAKSAALDRDRDSSRRDRDRRDRDDDDDDVGSSSRRRKPYDADDRYDDEDDD